MDSEFLKLRSGVHSESWCASNDKIDVFYTEGLTETYIGSVIRKVTFCGYAWAVSGPKNEALYTISSPSCSLSTFCRFPCGKCQGVDFEIAPTKTPPVSCGEIKKKWVCSCSRESIPENCKVKFPAGASWQEKALLIAASVWMHEDQFMKCSCIF